MPTPTEGNDILYGTAGDDTISGLGGSDNIYGGDGNDTINGGAGDDYLDGGPGNDRIITGNGADTVIGGDGDDEVNGYPTGEGTYNVWNSAGPLKVTAGAGKDFVVGSSGSDILDGGAGDDELYGNNGNDTLDGGIGADKLYGGDGNDTLTGAAGRDYLWGGTGDDTLDGGDDSDELVADAGRDTLRGGAGNDRLWVASNSTDPALMYGDDGDDTISGGVGNDTLDGGAGDDELYGNNGNDTLDGGIGADKLYGGDGNDTLTGGEGNDTIQGGDGSDTLDGGSGSDKLYGEVGDDYYVVDSLSDYVQDNQGSNTGLVKVDFYKQPAGVTWKLADGVKSLPYWVDALVKAGTTYSDAQATVAVGVIRYAFPTAVLATWDEADKRGFTPFNAEQRAFVAKIFAYIETIINVRFEMASDASEKGVLTFANNQQSGSGGYATGSLSSPKWAVFINNTGLSAAAYAAPKEGDYAAHLFIHEIGHALGLKHPHDKTAGEGGVSDGPYLSIEEDITTYTQLSYTQKQADYVSQLRDLDIAALQYLYGPAAKPGTADHLLGNNTYLLSTNSSNFIWDGGGIDTLDASGADKRVVLNLYVGEHSYFGSAASQHITAAGQITINIGTVIENAYGTAFDDVIIGNTEDNTIRGNAGNDSLAGGTGDDKLSGGLGDDTLDGGDGVDVVYYNSEGFASGVIVDVQAGTVTGGAGNDKLISVERIWGTEKGDRFFGSGTNDYFVGDAGDDYADGRDGSDIFQINNDLADCTFYQDGLTCVIVTKNLGTDRLENFERVVFVGATTVWKTIAELQALTSPNGAPVFSAANQSVTTNEDTTKAITVNATDPNNDALTYTVSTTPLHGTISVSGGIITYSPAPNYNGTDSFVVTASDGKGGTAAQTVNISVAAVNDAPTFPASSQSIIANAGVAKIIALSANDVDGDTLAYSAAPPTKGAVSISGSTLTYTPLAGASGTDSFLVTASDGKGGTATQTINVSFNTAPTFSTPTQAIIAVAGAAKAVTLSASDVDGDALTYTVAAPSKGTASIAGSTLIYTPASSSQGTDSFVVTASDGKGGTASQTVSVTLDDYSNTTGSKGVVTVGGAVTTGLIEFVGDTDVFKVTLRAGETYKFALTALSGALDPYLSLFDPAVTQVASNGDNGSSKNSEFTYTALISGSYLLLAQDTASGLGSYTVTAALANRPPAFSNPSQSISTNEDGSKSITVSATDADNDALTYTISTAASYGTTSFSGGTITYTPTANFNGSDNFVLSVSDGRGGTAAQTINVTVTPVNDAPTFLAASQSVSTTAGTAKTITLSATDVDGDTLTYTVATPGKGAASISGNTLTYTPSSTASGSDSFVITVSDGNGGTATQTINATISTALAPKAFTIYTKTGWVGSVGGNGTVLGTNGFEDVSVLYGQVSLDGSFSRGTDILRVPGDGGDFMIGRSNASTAFLEAGNAVRVSVPMGSLGLGVVFTDGVRKLVYSGGYKIGGQSFTAEGTQITAAADGTSLPSGADTSAQASVFLNSAGLSGGSAPDITLSGKARILGTNGIDVIKLADAGADLVFDGSFGRGGDIIILTKAAADYQAARLNASTLVLTSDDERLTIPVGTKGLTLRFADEDRVLIYKSGALHIGDQPFSSATATALSPSTISLSIDQGTPNDAVSLDGAGKVIFTDNASQTTNVILANFGKDDLIRVTGATALQYNFTLSSDDPKDLEITYTDPVTSASNLIVLDNVIANDTFVGDYETAAQAVGWNFMTFG